MKDYIKYIAAILISILLILIISWSFREAYYNINNPISIALVVIGVISLGSLLILYFALLIDWLSEDINNKNDPYDDYWPDHNW